MATKTTPTAVADRQAYAPDVRQPDFFMFTEAMKAHDDDGDGECPMVLCTASSTAIDLEADRFTTNALKQMKEGFVGKLIFLNHSYKVPQDVFGVVTKAELVKREGRLDLDMVIRVETGNPLAVQTYEYVLNGTRLGVSVGVIVTEAEKSDDEDDFGKRIVDISGVIPLEASIVGVPANQTAWTQEAVKSLFERGAIDFDEDEISARPWLVATAGVGKEAVAAPFEELEIEGKGVVGGHSPAKAPRDRAWQRAPAVKRLRIWAGGPLAFAINWNKYRTGFAWFDSENRENFGAYKLPHHDIVNDSFVVVFRGAVAAAVVLQGGRGGVNIPEGEVGRVKSHIARHYSQFDEKAPWEREKDDGWLNSELEIADALMAQSVIANELPAFDKATWPEEKEANEMADISDEERAAQEAAAATAENGEAKADAGDDGSEEEPEEKDTAAKEPEEEDEAEKPEAKGESENKDDDDSDDSGDSDDSDSKDDDDDSDESEESDSKEDAAETDENKEEGDKSESKGDFEDDVTADQAADALIDKMFTGLYVALNNLIPIFLNTDLSAGNRAKEGKEVIESWQAFIEDTWDEITDNLDSDKDVEPNEEFDLATSLHTLIAAKDAASCTQNGLDAVTAKVKEIGDSAEATADANTRLQEKVEQQDKALKYMQQVLEAMMELPLKTITTREGEVAQSLAEQYPALDARVVERMARFAPPESE